MNKIISCYKILILIMKSLMKNLQILMMNFRDKNMKTRFAVLK